MRSWAPSPAAPPGYIEGVGGYYKLVKPQDPACEFFQCDFCRGGRDSHSPTCGRANTALADPTHFANLFYNCCGGCGWMDGSGSETHCGHSATML